MDKIKGQLAGVAAGFVKYGEIVTKLDALESQEHSTVDTSNIESAIAVLEEKVSKLENADTSHEHDFDHTHDSTATKILEKEIELLKVQIEEIRISSSNPLAN